MRSNRVTIIQNSSRKTIPEVFFTVCGTFHGLTYTPRVTPLLAILWITIFGLNWIGLLWATKYMVFDSTRSAGLSDMALIFGKSIDIGASSYIVFSFFRKQGDIRPLLRRSERKSKDVFLPWVFEIPFVCYFAYRGIMARRGPMAALSHLITIPNETPMAMFLMVYAELLNSLIESSTELSMLCKDPKKSLDELIAAKWKLRDKIKIVNEFSSLPLLSHYIKMIGRAFYAFVKVFAFRTGGFDMFALCSHATAYILTMYYFARRTAALDLQRNGMAQDILMRNSIKTVDSVVAKRVFRFRADLDVVHLGCLVHGPKVFLETILFLLTTVIPLMCQFDQSVMRRMANLTNNAAPELQQDPFRSGQD